MSITLAVKDLALSLSLAIGILISAASVRAQPQWRLVVGRNVQVSLAHSARQHYEAWIATDPLDASHLIAGAYVVNSNKTIDNLFYVSFDGGRIWRHTLTVPAGVDPSCAIGFKGVAFAASIHDITQSNGQSDSLLVVHRSADGGRTWQASSIEVNTRSFDRNYLTIDDRRGRVYVHGYLQQPKDPNGNKLPSCFALYTSSDRGLNFDREVIRPSTDFATPWFFPANGIVTDDGIFIALLAELDKSKRNLSLSTDSASAPKEVNGAIKVVRSRDGGYTLEPASRIADVHYDWRVAQLSMSSLAIDSGSGRFLKRLYAVWPDAGIDARTQILFSSSDDLGQTWTTPRIVSDDAVSLKPGQRPNNFMPMIAVNKNGVVGISWYDRRDNPDNLGYWVRFSASLDGGKTWLPSVKVTTHSNLVEAGDIRFNGGDTAGLAADAAGVFHVCWIDNRTGVHQVWTNTVVVSKYSS